MKTLEKWEKIVEKLVFQYTFSFILLFDRQIVLSKYTYMLMKTSDIRENDAKLGGVPLKLLLIA